MKDCQLLYKYIYQLDGSIEAPLDLVSQAIYGKTVALINIEQSRQKINEIFDFLELKRRWDIANEEGQGDLKLRPEYFELKEYQFESMDEVEKALKNKVFL